jgi:hypothetical protein
VSGYGSRLGYLFYHQYTQLTLGVELCTLNRELTDIDVGIRSTTNEIHTTLAITTKIWRLTVEGKR